MNSTQRKSAPCPERFYERVTESHCVSVAGGLNDNWLASGSQSQPFGSIPCLRNSARANSFIQLPRLTPSRAAAVSICSRSSGLIRIWKVGDFPDADFFESLFIIDMYVPTGLMFYLMGTYPNMVIPKKTTPQTAVTVTRRLTTTLSEVTSWLLYMIPNQELLLHRYPLASRVGAIMTNLPHDYYVSLLKILLKKSTPAEKYSIALMLEREAMHIAGVNHAVFDAKADLVAKVTTGGRHACN